MHLFPKIIALSVLVVSPLYARQHAVTNGDCISLAHSTLCEVNPPADLDLDSTFIVPEKFLPRSSSLFSALKHAALGLLREIPSALAQRRNRSISAPHLWERFTYPAALNPGSGASSGLYVFIHGLNSHPAIWEPYLERLRDETSGVSVWVPVVPQQGNCCEDLAVRELVATLQEFLRHHPGEPIILVGSSLGARLAARIELALRKQASTLALFSVAGVHFGSNRIIFRKLHTERKLYENLHFGSVASQALVSAQRQQLPAQVERSYTFYVSRHDSQVVPAQSGLPLLGHGERFFVVEGVDHWGMVPELAGTIVVAAEAWRKNQPRRVLKG